MQGAGFRNPAAREIEEYTTADGGKERMRPQRVGPAPDCAVTSPATALLPVPRPRHSARLLRFGDISCAVPGTLSATSIRNGLASRIKAKRLLAHILDKAWHHRHRAPKVRLSKMTPDATIRCDYPYLSAAQIRPGAVRIKPSGDRLSKC
jgi:hypothetical protein